MAQVARYELIERAGGGGMATVWRAWDPRIRREVAVKLMSEALLDDPLFLARFDAEAQTVGRLQHEAVLPLFDYGEHEGVPYLVSPLMRGGTLSLRIISRARPMEAPEALAILGRIAAAIDYAHDEGVVHRDIKPANILFDDRGLAYLADFGIARLLEHSPGLTSTNAQIGTPRYMSPEQAAGEPATPASDIYSFGVVAYELLTGSVPFNAPSTPTVVYMHLHEPPPLPSSINPALPPGIDQALMRALEKDPAWRHGRATDLAAACRRAFEEAGPLPVTVADGPGQRGGGNPVSVQLDPPTKAGRLRATYSVVLENDGDEDALVDIRATDEEEAIDFRVEARALVPAHSSVRVTVEVRPLKRRMVGAPIDRSFEIAALAGDPSVPATVVTGAYRDVPVMHGAERVAAIGLVGFLVAAATLFGLASLGSDGGSNAASPDDAGHTGPAPEETRGEDEPADDPEPAPTGTLPPSGGAAPTPTEGNIGNAGETPLPAPTPGVLNAIEVVAVTPEAVALGETVTVRIELMVTLGAREEAFVQLGVHVFSDGTCTEQIGGSFLEPIPVQRGENTVVFEHEVVFDEAGRERSVSYPSVRWIDSGTREAIGDLSIEPEPCVPAAE